MNKRLLYLFVGIIGVFSIFALILYSQQKTQSSPKTLATAAPTTQNKIRTKTTSTFGTAEVTPMPLDAKGMAQKFYYYYFSFPDNPLAGGKYKTSDYLSSDFKDVIHDLYKNGDTPVFCPQNQREDVTVGQETQVYYDNAYLTQVVLSEAPPGKKDLYRVELENWTGKWRIFDINCI